MKGSEIQLPEGISFSDADGHSRDKARIKWWADPENPSLKLKDVVLEVPSGTLSEDAPVSTGVKKLMRELNPPGSKQTFFGHYWQKGATPTVESKTAICIDQSVAKDGHLAAATITVDDGKIIDMSFTSVKSRPPYVRNKSSGSIGK